MNESFCFDNCFKAKMKSVHNSRNTLAFLKASKYQEAMGRPSARLARITWCQQCFIRTNNKYLVQVLFHRLAHDWYQGIFGWSLSHINSGTRSHAAFTHNRYHNHSREVAYLCGASEDTSHAAHRMNLWTFPTQSHCYMYVMCFHGDFSEWQRNAVWEM